MSFIIIKKPKKFSKLICFKLTWKIFFWPTEKLKKIHYLIWLYSNSHLAWFIFWSGAPNWIIHVPNDSNQKPRINHEEISIIIIKNTQRKSQN